VTYEGTQQQRRLESAVSNNAGTTLRIFKINHDGNG